MANPQQPELARSRKTPSQDQDSVAGVVEGQRGLSADAPRGPIPPENQPGSHPEQEQDKPDLDAFAERFGVVEASGADPQANGRSSELVGRAEEMVAGLRSSKSGIFAAGAAVLSIIAALVGVLLSRKRRRARRR